ncbi:ABC transporter ATP-binding protein [Thermoleptolyngbya sp.]
MSDRNRRSSLIREIWHLLGYLSRRRKRQLGLLLILMMTSSLSEVISLGAVFPFLGALSNADRILNSPQWQPLWENLRIETPGQLVAILALVFIVAVLVANALRLLTLNVQTHLGAGLGSDISCQLFSKTLLQPYSFHVQHSSSDLINLVTVDARKLTSFIFIPLLTLVTNSLVVMALVSGLFLIDTQTATISAVALGGAYTLLYRWRRKVLARNSQILVETNQQQIKVVQEGVGGIRDVLIGGTHEFFQQVYKEADIPYCHATASNQVISQSPRYIIEALAMSAIGLLALGMGRGGDFTQVLPVLGSLALGANRLLPTVQGVFGAIVQMQSARASLQRVLIALQRPIDPMLVWLPSQGLPLEEELRFDRVWFRYSQDSDWVLKDLSLKIAAKTTVAFVGSTGSGKSTSADLILGLLKPQKGTISVDGQPLEGERLRQWQQCIAHVPQSIFLTDATITENIAFGIPKEKIDFEQVWQAARLAQIDDYIAQLPAGYDTYVGERGVRLSGGQRQRIGIARALYRQASVIIFDEATSALDNATEREVMAAIHGLSRQFTVILIAHRLSTVEKCDVIFELNQGRLTAKGSYQDLVVTSSSFRTMVQGINQCR